MKGCLKTILILVGIAGLLIAAFFVWIYLEVDEAREQDAAKEATNWNSFQVGDSVFFDPEENYQFELYRKYRVELSRYDEDKFDYKKSDSIELGVERSLHEKYFFKKGTGYVGTVKAKDKTRYSSIYYGIPNVFTFDESPYSNWIILELSPILAKVPIDYRNKDILDKSLVGKNWNGNKISSVGNTRLESNELFIKAEHVKPFETIK